MANGSISAYKGSRTPTGKGSSSSIVGQLFLSKMLSNPNYKTTITLPGNMGVVSGFCEGPFAFNGSADWKPIADLGQVEDQFAAAYAVFSAFNRQAGNETSTGQLSFKQIRGTEMRYGGSGCPTFQVKLILPSYNANAKQSPLDSVKLLMACVYPRYAGTSLAGDQLEAPLGYDIKFNSNQQNDAPINTVTVERGRFFKAHNMLVKQVSTTFSQECMEDGYPLYIEANIEFQPWRTPDYKTAMSWFGNF